MKKLLAALLIVVFVVGAPMARAQEAENPNQALIEQIQAQLALLYQLLDLMNQLQATQHNVADTVNQIHDNQTNQVIIQGDDDEEFSPSGTITLTDPKPLSPQYVDITHGGGVTIRALINNGEYKNTPVYLDTPTGTLSMSPSASFGKWKHTVGYVPTESGIQSFTIRAPEFNVSQNFQIEFIQRDAIDSN